MRRDDKERENFNGIMKTYIEKVLLSLYAFWPPSFPAPTHRHVHVLRNSGKKT